MKRRQAQPEVRAALVERYRTRLTRPWCSPQTSRRLADLEAGRPVELPGWELSRWLPGASALPLVRLEQDGSVTRMDRFCPAPGEVRYRPAGPVDVASNDVSKTTYNADTEEPA